MTLTLSKEGLDLIKRWEGLRLTPYRCSAGVPTIGYGSTYYEDGKRVTMTDPAITKERAEKMLASHAQKYADGVARYVQVRITQAQFDALTAFAYNVGLSAFLGSTLLRMINQGQHRAAAEQFLRWNRAGGRVVAGLTNRRQAERAMYLKGL